MGIKTFGFVLEKINYDKFDALLRIYTKDFGLLNFVSRSFNKPEGKLKSIFNLFNQVEFNFVIKGETNLLTTGYLLEEYKINNFLAGAGFLYVSSLLIKSQPENLGEITVYNLIYKTFSVLSRLKDKKSILNLVLNFEKILLLQGGFIDDAQKNFLDKHEVKKILPYSNLIDLRDLIIRYVS